MDRNFEKRTAPVVLALASFALAAMFLAVVPGATRSWLVANVGVHTANNVRLAAYFVGAVLVLVGGYATVRAARVFITDFRDAAVRRREQENPYQLPSKDESDPAVVGWHLVQARLWYPDEDFRRLIDESFSQLAEIQKVTESVDEIFKANPGIITAGNRDYRFGEYELRLDQVIAQTCRDLVGIVNLAYVPHGTEVEVLKDAIRRVNDVHHGRIELARELARSAAELVTKDSTSDDPTKHLRELIDQLSETTIREENP